jgi:hypothetical protein
MVSYWAERARLIPKITLDTLITSFDAWLFDEPTTSTVPAKVLYNFIRIGAWSRSDYKRIYHEWMEEKETSAHTAEPNHLAESQ